MTTHVKQKTSSRTAPQELLILPVKNIVIFPNVIFPLTLEDPELIELVNEALINRNEIGIFTVHSYNLFQ